MSAVRPRDAEFDEEPYLSLGLGAACPPPDVILPAIEGTLAPASLAARVGAHVAACPLCSELAAAMTSAAESPTAPEEARISARISASVSPSVARATSVRPRAWRTAYAIAATLVMIGTGAYVAQFAERTAAPAVNAPVQGAPEVGAVRAVLPLAAGQIELPPESLTLRSSTADPYAAALEHGLEPFARGNYVQAAGRLGRVARAYPRSAHAALYLGVSRLMLGRVHEALAPLERARALARPGTSLYAEATWYLAVALDHSGQADASVVPLLELCGSRGARDAQACEGLGRVLLKR